MSIFIDIVVYLMEFQLHVSVEFREQRQRVGFDIIATNQKEFEIENGILIGQCSIKSLCLSFKI